MSPPVCPEGHESEATDYCDTCGSPMGRQPSPPVPGRPSPGLAASVGPGVPDAGSVAGQGSVLDLDLSSGTGQSLTCPHCGAPNVVDALFCEACGYDFTTGAAPLGAEPEVESEVEPGSEVEAAAEAEPEVEAAAEAEPEVGPEPEAGSSPEAEPNPDVVPEVALEPEPDGPPAAELGPDAQPVAGDDEASQGDVVSGGDEPEVEEPEVEEPEVEEPQADSEQARPGADGGAPEHEDAPEHADPAPVDGDEDDPAAAEPPHAPPGREAAAAHARPRHTPPSRDLADTWVVEIWVDPDWYAVQQTDEAVPSPGVPDIVVVRRNQALIGRPSGSLGVRPDIDAGADTAVSRRHAQLTSDGRRWWIEDLGSSNGTFVGVVGDPLPTEAIRPGQRVEIDRDDRIYVGAWTRLVLRQATEAERKGQG